MSEEERGGSRRAADSVLLADVKGEADSPAPTLFLSYTEQEEAGRDGEKTDGSSKEIPGIKSRFTKSQEENDFGRTIPKTLSVTDTP